MSYDLHLFRPVPGTDLAAAAESSLDAAEDAAEDPGPPDPAAEARKRELVDALRRVNPVLTPFQFDHAAIARHASISEDEARRRWRHVELNGADDGNGIQIALHDATASVTLPYWHRDAAARATWEEVWSYLRVLESQGGFRTWDPQIERVLDLARDLEAVLSAYARGVTALDRVASTGYGAAPAKRPWWKLW